MSKPCDDPRASLRRGIYLILMTIGLGAVLGRILAVDAIDRTALHNDRANRELKLQRDKLQAKGIGGEELAEQLHDVEAKLRSLPPVRRPFLSANDRSRWCTVRALVEPEMQVEGAPYAIDLVVRQDGWDTIDMVKHGKDGGHLYSSKPTLLPTLIAGEYWLIYKTTGLSLATHPFEVGRFMLITINGACLLVYFLAVAGMVERLGTTDWGRIFVMAATVFGTFLTTFAIVLTNHLVAAACAAAALYSFVRIWCEGDCRARWFAMAGFFCAMLAANELPGAALAAVLGLVLLWKAPRHTLMAFAPPALVVAAAFFWTNWIAHRSFKPAYMHRRPIVCAPVDEEVPGQVRDAVRTALAGSGGKPWTSGPKDTVKAAVKASTADAVRQSGREAVRQAVQSEVQKAVADTFKSFDKAAVQDAVKTALEEADKETERPDNWYDYAYDRGRTVDSYWRAPVGVDRGEKSVAVYTLHSLVGHHGIFSLTPVWLMAVCGTLLWLRRGPDARARGLAAIVGGVSLVCIAFYLWWPSLDRNYGGMSSGFREIFWLAPAWLVVLLPAADACSSRRTAQAVALALLLVSVLSASYATWNPWTPPWTVDFANFMGWLQRP
jgi:hypothetical protein